VAPSLTQLLPSFRQFQLVYVALRLGIPAALAADPRTLAELAAQLQLPEHRILRLLRGLVWAGIISFDQARGFSLTAEGESLLDRSPTSLAGGTVPMPIGGCELARDSEGKIACKQASYTDHLTALFSTGEAGIY
jgi:hypothetical protein